jgi:hypothetical protein
MKLRQIYEAQETWQNLAALKLPAQTAYKLMKYTKLVSAEIKIIEERRIALIKESGTADASGAVAVKPDTPEFDKFLTDFGEFLATESDLALFDLALNSLIDLAGKAQNTLSVNNLVALEPFFKSEE